MIHQRNNFFHGESLKLHSGKSLKEFKLVYDTYGKLNEAKDNAILVFHSFSGSHHASGQLPEDKEVGWWNDFIGPEKVLNTNKYFVICVNNIGSCYGSTGPLSNIHGSENKYLESFPDIHVVDWVTTQSILLKSLGIHLIKLMIGSSLGGMQVLQFVSQNQFHIEKSVIIGATPKPKIRNLLMNYIQREMLESGSNNSLAHARMFSHLFYISNNFLKNQFDYRKQDKKSKINDRVKYEFENYFSYQANKFSKRFNKHSYILMTKAMDSFFFEEALYKAIKSNLLLISFENDELYSYDDMSKFQTELINNDVKSNHVHLDGSRGHDSFLKLTPDYEKALNNFINN